MQNYVKGGREGVTWPTFAILAHISGTVGARDFKFGESMHNDNTSEDQ